MKNLKIELVNADVIDNFESYKSDSTSVILDGVVHRANLKISLKDDAEVFMNYSVMLNLPKLESFLDVQDVTKAKIVKWATDTFSDNEKEMFEKTLSKRKEGKLPVTKKVTFD